MSGIYKRTRGVEPVKATKATRALKFKVGDANFTFYSDTNDGKINKIGMENAHYDIIKGDAQVQKLDILMGVSISHDFEFASRGLGNQWILCKKIEENLKVMTIVKKGNLYQITYVTMENVDPSTFREIKVEEKQIIPSLMDQEIKRDAERRKEAEQNKLFKQIEQRKREEEEEEQKRQSRSEAVKQKEEEVKRKKEDEKRKEQEELENGIKRKDEKRGESKPPQKRFSKLPSVGLTDNRV